MCKENKREHPLLHPVRVVHPLGEHALLHLLDQLGLLHVVRHRVGGHVKQQEVLLLCGQHTFFHLRFEFKTQGNWKSITRFLASLSLTFLSWYLSLSGFQVSPDKYSIHVCKDKGQHLIQEERKGWHEIPELFPAGWSPWCAWALHQGEHLHRGQSFSIWSCDRVDFSVACQPCYNQGWEYSSNFLT